MDRLFGSAKAKQPGPSLSETSDIMQRRLGSLDEKIRKLDGELLVLKEKISRSPAGSPAGDGLRRQAMQVLQQKKQYESQRGTLSSQAFNVEQTAFAIENSQATVETVAAMKVASKQLKSSMKAININTVESLHDTLTDLMEESKEINEVLSRSYNTPDYIDDDELNSELQMLADSSFYETESVSPVSYIGVGAGLGAEVVSSEVVSKPSRSHGNTELIPM